MAGPRINPIAAMALGAMFCVSLGVLLAGCATDVEPTQEYLKSAWDARNVPPADYKGDVLAYMRTYLNDPAKVRGAVISAPALKLVPGNPGDRYISCVRYNARKSDGHYAGNNTIVAVFAGGRLDRFLDAPPVVRDVCKDATLDPFPEMEKLTR
jgi:hypothetical protein